ncbi:MAG TPA: hypothetical protein PKD57_12850, partial [Saprospiraceae bacterium]|nr:hypothetical protein [Saprospiraceae bacterium]
SFLSDVRLERDDMDNMFCAFRKSRAVIKDCFIQLNGSLRDNKVFILLIQTQSFQKRSGL